jgi:hypothetical protein
MTASRTITFEQMHSLHRYYMWCNTMKGHFIQNQISGSPDPELKLLLPQNYMCYWYGGLYVVIEGYDDLKLGDPAINALVASENTELLRRFRNCVFHYQEEYHDKRFTDFMTQGQNVIQWVESLHREFDRLFAAHSASLTPKK